MTSTQPQYNQLPLEEPPGTPPYIAELLGEMSRVDHETVSDNSSQYTVDLAGGMRECGNGPASFQNSMQEILDTTYGFAYDQSRLYENTGFRANGFTVFDTTQPSITHHLPPSVSGYPNDELLLPHGNFATPVDDLLGQLDPYHMQPVASIYTTVPGYDTITYTGDLVVDAPYSLDWPIMTSAGNSSSVQADDSVLLSTQFWNPGLGMPDSASWLSQPVGTTSCFTNPRPMVPSINVVSQTDRRVSTKRKRATCPGIFGECPHRFEDTRCFTQIEIDTCNRLCNLLTGRPLDWSIYGLGPGDVKLFRSK
jgi:hypothetical protein